MWKFFAKINETTAKCKICGNELSCKGSSTSGLSRHLECVHKKKVSLNPKIDFALKRPKNSFPKDKFKILEDEAMRAIVKDGLAIGAFEKEGMKGFVSLATGYEFEGFSRRQLKRKLNRAFREKKSGLIEKFQSLDTFCLTTDIWSAVSRHSYISTTCHYLAKGKMRSTVLDFSVFTGKHTGERIAKKLVDVIEEFNIADRVFSITLDNASNNKRAMKLIQSTHKHIRSFPCFAHLLNLVVTNGLINGYLAVKDAVRKCLEDEITSAQTLSSKRNMSSCILMPSENAALMELATLLKPFKEATKLMSGQKYTTIGMGLAIIKRLSAACAASETDSEFILSCKSKLNTQLTRYFYDAQGESIRPDIKTLVEVSAFLNPEYKNTLAPNEVGDVERFLRHEFRSEVIHENTATQQAPVESPVENWLSSVGMIMTTVQPSKDELKDYKTVSGNIPGISFWAGEIGATLPNLKKIAQQYLVIPLTSVPSESAFSRAGFIVRRRRVNLSAETVQQIIFLQNKM